MSAKVENQKWVQLGPTYHYILHAKCKRANLFGPHKKLRHVGGVKCSRHVVFAVVLQSPAWLEETGRACLISYRRMSLPLDPEKIVSTSQIMHRGLSELQC